MKDLEPNPFCKRCNGTGKLTLAGYISPCNCYLDIEAARKRVFEEAEKVRKEIEGWPEWMPRTLGPIPTMPKFPATIRVKVLRESPWFQGETEEDEKKLTEILGRGYFPGTAEVRRKLKDAGVEVLTEHGRRF